MTAANPTDALRVLLVDDDVDCREFIALALEEAGFRVFHVRTAELGIDALARQTFDAVATDKNLPGIDGVQFIKHIRQKHGDLPVILITGYGTVSATADAFRTGAQGYLTKPLDPEELANALRHAVSKRRQAAAMGAQLASLRQAPR